MRGFVFFLVVVGGLWIVDVAAFGGRYSSAFLEEAQHQGRRVSYNIDYWLGRTGL